MNYLFAISRFRDEDSQLKDSSAVQSNDFRSVPSQPSCCSSRDDVL